MITLTDIFAFVLTLGLLIVIHEYGHYRVALACGVKVLRFSIGFGRVVWRRQPRPDGTEFVISALPLGGYVRMLDEREGEVAAADLDRAFNRKSLWQRTAIVAAGPLANLLLAVLLYSIQHWIGIDEPKARLAAPASGTLAERAGLHAGDVVSAVSFDGEQWEDVRSMADLNWELTEAVVQGKRLHLMVSNRDGHGQHPVVLELGSLGTKNIDPELMRSIGLGLPYRSIEPLIRGVVNGGAADKGGLLAGDRVLSIDGTEVRDTQQLLEIIRSSVDLATGHAPVWRIWRAGQVIELGLQPAVVTEGGKPVGRIGASLGGAVEMVTVRDGLWDGLSHAVSRTWGMSSLTLRMLGRMLIGEASLKNLSGPLTIADYAGEAVRMGLPYYLGLLAMVSVSLGVLNLLPLPMLDGGHLMYYLFEAVTGRPPSDAWLERLQRSGAAIMLMMMSLAFYNDVVRLLGPH